MAGPEYWRNTLVVVPIVGTSVATIVYLLRLYCRYLAGTHVKAEDILMGIGLFFTYGVTGCYVVQGFSGIGETISNLPQHLRMRTALVAWLAQKFWPPAQVFVKVSIVIFLRRLLGTIDGFRHIATGIIVFSIVWGSTAIIGNTFQCWPPQYFFVKHIDGHCMAGQNIFFIVIGSLSLAEDVVILCLPMPIVWRLQMATRQKIEMTIIFSIGGLVCVFSLLRLIYFRKYSTDDLSGTAALESIWTILELDVAIICGSTLLIKPLFQACVGLMRNTITRPSQRQDSSNTPQALMINKPDSIFTGASHDLCSGIRSEICTTPTLERNEQTEWNWGLEMGRIYVDTSINQGLELHSDTCSMGSRRGSSAMASLPSQRRPSILHP